MPEDTHVGAVQVYDEPTVLVCYRVTGEEEVPEGVVGVLTPDAPDVLSHLSVRARNMKVSANRSAVASSRHSFSR